MSSEPKAEGNESGSAANRVVVLTGATGALGSQLANFLEPLGYELRALVRSPTSQPDGNFSQVLDWETARANDAALEALLTGAFAVVHLASSQSKHPERQQDAHLHMPDRLLTLGARMGLARFISLSSIKAIAGEMAPGPLSVDQVPAPDSDYGRYKLAAEQLVRDHPANETVATWILRLPMVYGPNAIGNFRLLRWVARWGLPLPVASTNRRSILYINNLFCLLERLLIEPVSEGHSPSATVLHVADPEALSTQQLLTLIVEAEGGRMHGITLPSHWAEKFRKVPVAGGLFTRLLGSLELDVGAVPGWDDWRPPYSTEQGIAESIRR